jgi:hypothetical protein
MYGSQTASAITATRLVLLLREVLPAPLAGTTEALGLAPAEPEVPAAGVLPLAELGATTGPGPPEKTEVTALDGAAPPDTGAVSGPMGVGLPEVRGGTPA